MPKIPSATQPLIETAALEDLYLDANNPRLGRHNVEKGLSQDEVLEIMGEWSLEELAVSFLESGYWPQEAVIAVRENIGRIKNALVVVEGNRRLAALKKLYRVRAGEENSKKWNELIQGYSATAFARLEQVPYILKPSRNSVRSYLGYRHVTGIKEWNPAEKAQFIAELIEEDKLTYEQVRKRIGSKTPTVRQTYISYRLLLQMENSAEDIDVTKVEDRFSVLYLSLRTEGVRQYLQIDIDADTTTAKKPVPKERLAQLTNFAKWLFGDDTHEPVVSDSRLVDEFGKILESPAAVHYLERTEIPSFSVARRMAGVAESVVAEHIERAADEVEEALKAAHQHKTSNRLKIAVKRLGQDVDQLLEVFPNVRKEIQEVENDA
jgi:hypothetical protein